MSRKSVYLILAVIGALLPYVFFIPFIIDNVLDLSLFIKLLFDNAVSTGFAADLLLSSLIFFGFMLQDRKENSVSLSRVEIAIMVNFLIGLSAAFPLYLYFREVNE